MSLIQKRIEDFTYGAGTQYTFPAELNVEERKLVKATAEKLGLSSRSFGMGTERQIHIFKPTSWTASTAEPSANSETETGSTVDSESERQDPTISIKNTFVHIEMDNADPRIIQSMPAGTFAANLEAEKGEESMDADSRSHKTRPSALLQISPSSDQGETESETVASLMFPSTPNAENFMNLNVFPNDMSMQGIGQTDAVHVVQWVPPMAAPPLESAPLLQPMCSAPQALFSNEHSQLVHAAPAVPHGPPQGWAQLPQTVPQGPPHGTSQEQLQGPPHGPPLALPHGPQVQPQRPLPFLPGTPIVLQGLASQPDFNGLHGVVSAFDEECGRYNVMIEIGPNAVKRLVKVKSQNLQPAQLLAQPPCCSERQSPCFPPMQQPVVAGRSAKASLVLSHMV
jgi:hypothetical protein